MNAPTLVKQGSRMWQGVTRAWSSIQSGLEQQDPTTWAEIQRQPLFGNRFLTNATGIRWGTENKTKMRGWAAKGYQSLNDILQPNGQAWMSFPELTRIYRAAREAPELYAQLVNNIPWEAAP